MLSCRFFPSITRGLFTASFFIFLGLAALQAQVDADPKPKPVRYTFPSVWLIDQQTVDVPIKGTLEMDINHRFGTIANGASDFFGLWAPGNIRLGLNYAPVNRLFVGFAVNKLNLLWDFNLKYALLRQTRTSSVPLSISYYGNMAVDTRKKDNFVNGSDRWSYFHSLVIGRKFSQKVSLQISPSISHFNAVEGYLTTDARVEGKMKNDHFALSLGGRFGIGSSSALILTYDLPITDHPVDNPRANFGLGYEVTTSSHAFQFFFTNFYNLVPQYNHVFNRNRPPLVLGDLPEGEDRVNFNGWLIGFNMTRLWNF